MILTSPLGENNKVKKQLRWLELYLSLLLESGPAPSEIKQDKHICKESRENSKKTPNLLFVLLTLICNLAAGERQAQHKVLPDTPRTWQA